MDCQNNTLGFEKYTGASLTGKAYSLTSFCLKVLRSIPAHSLFELVDPVLTPVFMMSFFGSRDGDNSCNFLIDCQNNTLGFEKYTSDFHTGTADSVTNFCLKVLLSIPARTLFELDPVMTLVFMTSFFGSKGQIMSECIL